MYFSIFNNRMNIMALMAILFISSCTKDTSTPTPTDVTKEQKIASASYGNNERNKMDVYLPGNRDSNTPFVLLIHGGGWISGDKGDMAAFQADLLARGIASASMNYRYASGIIHYEQQMEDVDKALTYCLSKADEWQIRKDKYVIGGASAGAHMSMLYAYRFNTQFPIAAVVSAAGPTDITDVDWLNYAAIINQLGNIQNMVGAQYNFGQELNARFAASSPIKGVKNIPTLMIHGDNDLVVPYTQSQKMVVAMNNAGYTNKLVTIPGANHDLGLANAATATLITNEIVAWVNMYGK